MPTSGQVRSNNCPGRAILFLVEQKRSLCRRLSLTTSLWSASPQSPSGRIASIYFCRRQQRLSALPQYETVWCCQDCCSPSSFLLHHAWHSGRISNCWHSFWSRPRFSEHNYLWLDLHRLPCEAYCCAVNLKQWTWHCFSADYCSFVNEEMVLQYIILQYYNIDIVAHIAKMAVSFFKTHPLMSPAFTGRMLAGQMVKSQPVENKSGGRFARWIYWMYFRSQ